MVVLVWLQILERDRAVVNDDRIKFDVLTSIEAHPVSDSSPDCFGFQTVKKAIRQIWGSQDVVVSPGFHYFIFILLSLRAGFSTTHSRPRPPRSTDQYQKSTFNTFKRIVNNKKVNNQATVKFTEKL